MTFEILISLYGIFLLFYMAYVLTKIIRMRRADRIAWENYKRNQRNSPLQGKHWRK